LPSSQRKPIRQLPARSPPLAIAFGAAELPELQRQPRAYASVREVAGLPTEPLPLAEHDHFSILEELADPAGQLCDVVMRLATQSHHPLSAWGEG